MNTIVTVSLVLSAFTEADYRERVAEIRAQIALAAPKTRFTIVEEPPFVVIGDEAPATVRQRAERTVRWAVTRLKAAYFKDDPKEVLAIWLFGSARSYQRHTRALFDDDPGTPFGYYSGEHRALIMNIATGGGTLVHEIVHPFIESNFPECPAWFNEGLGSLYEQSGVRDGHIIGFTNWRLAGLKEAIRANALPRFAELMATTEHEFYVLDPGSNYGQSRYLLYYLQEKGLLHDYYAAFTKNVGRDPTGMRTLKRILGRDDLDVFQKSWEAWVLKLTFP